MSLILTNMVFKSFYDVFFKGVQIESLGKQVMRLTCRTGQGLIVLESFYMLFSKEFKLRFCIVGKKIKIRKIFAVVD